MKYSTTSFPAENHIVISRTKQDALVMEIENGNLVICRWYNVIDMEGNLTDNWRVDPSSGISIDKNEIPKFMSTLYENRDKFQ